MTRFKNFGKGSLYTAEPISFELHDEKFDCVTQVQGKLLLSLIADSSSDDAAISSAIIVKFFTYVLKDESLERFEVLLEDKERIVSVETLSEITSWLIEEYTKRPETQPGV